jgi:hypothetical protein
MAKGRKRVESGANFQNYASTAASVAAIGTAARDKFFAVEMDHSISTPAGLDEDLCLINEHGLIVTKRPGFCVRPGLPKSIDYRICHQETWRFSLFLFSKLLL